MKVYKFPVPIEDRFTIALPLNSKILTFNSQGVFPYEQLFIWTLVDPEMIPIERKFILAETGHEIANKKIKYIGTVHISLGAAVFHLFEDLES